MMAGRPSSPVNAVTICCMAESSDTMYRKMVMSVHTLSSRPATAPYRWRVHSVRTKPSGHLRRMMGPRKPKTSSGRALDSAYTMTPWRPAMVAISGYVKRMPDPRAAWLELG